MRPGDSFVAQPVRSLQTMLRIIAMNNARISKAVPDGIYGPDTMQEVSALQRMSGLPQTGVVNEATWNEIARQFGPAAVNVLQAQPVEILLEPGEKIGHNQASPYVFLLQSMLTVLSMGNPIIPLPGHSGMMDDSTTAALRIFQSLSALEETGVLDRESWRQVALQFTLAALLQSSKMKQKSLAD